jgi:mycofactocin glycosyltransferase
VTATLHLTGDPGVRRYHGGRVVVGGTPLRVLRLSAAGARHLDRWLDGEPVDRRHHAFAGRLLRAGIVHPRWEAAPLTAADVTVVVPARDPAGPLPAPAGVARVLVVDDGSARPLPGAAVRHEHARGPAAARNSGWRLAGTDLVAFLDADVTPVDGWLGPVLAHFCDPAVDAVAPRVRSAPGSGLISRYERVRSPLDLGAQAAGVRPGGRVGHLPSAALVVRTASLRRLGGFAEDLRYGEDCDLVWRLAEAGGTVRYEPAAEVLHAPRPGLRQWCAQRFHYGTSAAPLALRHHHAVAPVRMSAWSALSWTAAAAGRPVAGAGLAAVTAALLPRKLRRAQVPGAESLRLATSGHLGAGRQLADAATRTWWPVALPALAATPTGRRLLAAAYARHVQDWYRLRPPVDLPRWLLLRGLDDLAYGAGVWWGAWRHRTVRPLLPHFSEWPGRDGVKEAS